MFERAEIDEEECEAASSLLTSSSLESQRVSRYPECRQRVPSQAHRNKCREKVKE